jgi:hypothetical protein
MKPRIITGTLPVHHIKVAPPANKSVRYENGVAPGSMNFVNAGVLGDLSKDAPMHASPASGPRPHPDLMTKVDEAADAKTHIGDTPRGLLDRLNN